MHKKKKCENKTKLKTTPNSRTHAYIIFLQKVGAKMIPKIILVKYIIIAKEIQS